VRAYIQEKVRAMVKVAIMPQVSGGPTRRRGRGVGTGRAPHCPGPLTVTPSPGPGGEGGGRGLIGLEGAWKKLGSTGPLSGCIHFQLWRPVWTRTFWWAPSTPRATVGPFSPREGRRV